MLYMSKKNTGTQRHYYKNLLSIGIPIVIGQLGTIILGFADTIMIGHHSTEELAAAGLVNNIYTLVFVMYMGFTYGLTPIIGRLYGEERIDSIGQKVRNSLFANMLTGTLLSIALVVLYLNLSHIGQPEELLDLIRPYFIVNLVSVLFMGIFYTMKQFLDGVAETRVAMWVMIAGNVVNIFGNWLLIYGVAGFPELGLLGAGISTLLSRVLMAAAMVGIVIGRKKFAQYRYDILHSSITKADFREMNRLGLMVDLSHAAESSFYDALDISQTPIVCSHSSCRALCDHPRNLTDDQMRRLAAKGGVMQVTLYNGFLVNDGEATILDAMRHLEHAISIMGIDHVGLGTDFDGDGGIRGLRDSSELLQFTRQLLARRYSEEDIRKIWGGNFLRVMAQVQRA